MAAFECVARATLSRREEEMEQTPCAMQERLYWSSEGIFILKSKSMKEAAALGAALAASQPQHPSLISTLP